jgi:hypothetical protein
MPKGIPNKRYTPEFKKQVIETMRREKLSYGETARRFEINSHGAIERMGTNLFDRRAGRICCGAPWAKKYGTAKKAAGGTRRRPSRRESAASSGECLPKKIAGLGFGRRAESAQKALVIRELRRNYSLGILLEAAGLARSTYYYHEKRQAATDKYSDVKEAITAIFHENKGRYGYRRITAELRRARLCSEAQDGAAV